MTGKFCEEFVDQRVNKIDWIIRTKNKMYDLYKQIFDIRSRCVVCVVRELSCYSD